MGVFESRGFRVLFFLTIFTSITLSWTGANQGSGTRSSSGLLRLIKKPGPGLGVKESVRYRSVSQPENEVDGDEDEDDEESEEEEITNLEVQADNFGERRAFHPPPFPGTLRSSSQEAAEEEAEIKKPSTVAPEPLKVPRGTGIVPGGEVLEGDRRFRCICDTAECQGADTPTCPTSGHCYTQLLETEDGTPPVTRGCIPGETPLLCENRRPSSARRWPFLVCCKGDLCNAGTLPLQRGREATGIESKKEHSPNFEGRRPTSKDEALSTTAEVENQRRLVMVSTDPITTADVGMKRSPRPGKEPRLMSPLASSFLIGGALVIAVVSAVGTYILRRERRRRPGPDRLYARDLEEVRDDAEASVSPERSRSRTHQFSARDKKDRPGGVENETCMDETQRPFKETHQFSARDKKDRRGGVENETCMDETQRPFKEDAEAFRLHSHPAEDSKC